MSIIYEIKGKTDISKDNGELDRTLIGEWFLDIEISSGGVLEMLLPNKD